MKTKIDQLLAKVDRVLDRYLDDDADVTNFAKHRAFRWDGARRTLKPIPRPAKIHPNHLLGIDAIKHEVLRNTKSFVHGGKANNILLWGERGTGKSSLVKSLLTAFNKTPFRMIQIYRHDILSITSLYDLIAGHRSYRFILFIDDLSFEESQTDYKEMKTIMDGGIEDIPDNIFYHFSEETYLKIAAFYAAEYGVPATGEQLERMAIRWALEAGSQNGRTAEQFAKNAAVRD
jgi:predicted AAA+ superfamily ATPase